MLHSKLFLLKIVFALQLVFVFQSFGQSIEITAPLDDVAVKEGDDYAKTVLNNPWDFYQRRDIGWEENYVGSSVKVSGGVWSGTFQGQGAYLFPLFSGFKRLLHAEGLPGDRTLPGLGINHPIDANKYKVLSYRLKQSNRSSYAIYWTTDKTKSEYWPDGSNFGARFDGFYNNSRGYSHSDWYLYQYDLTNLSSTFQQSAGSWANRVYALRIDPSIAGPAGSTTEFDWIRLVDPTSAPQHTIVWNAENYPAKSIVTVYVDTDASGYDGTPMTQFAADLRNYYSFSTAILPPGTYYFYTTIRVDGTLSVVARSGYSAKLTITKAPSAYFTAPTQLTGEEYGTSAQNDPWDMSNSADVSNLSSSIPQVLRQYTNASFTNGIFKALADAKGTNPIGTDAQVHLKVSQTTPIDTRKYRYVNYRMMLDETLYPTISDKVFWGFVTRVVFWTNDILVDGVRPPAHVTWEGWHTYTYDMKGSNAGEGLLEAGVPYNASTTLTHFRLDPLETTLPTWFSIDWIKLNAENMPTNDIYNLSWFIEDGDSSSLTTSLYYDTDQSGYNGKLITSLSGLSTGAHSYTWDTKNIAKGNYYIYAVISDGLNSYRVYSPVHIAIGSTASNKRTRYDYDGDGKSDQVVFRPASSGSFLVSSSARGFISYTWGKTGDTALEGDFDGDKKSDPVVIRVDSAGNYTWLIRRSTDGQLYSKVFGKRGDIPIIGDYDGDKKDQIAVWRSGTWLILSSTGSTITKAWGATTDKPVPADFDGDGKTDYAVWRPSDGSWLIVNSGYARGYASTATTNKRWGGSVHRPLPADFTGDGKADMVVFDPSSCKWYVKDISNSSNYFSAQWGVRGDNPVIGDYNGDFIHDLSVVRPKVNYWFHNYRNGLQKSVQWGLAADVVPQ